jgi:serine/threonine-protein kinase
MSLQLGRYETVRTIAAGGMATVHLGRAVGAGGFERLVAIKVMHPHVEAEAEFVSMFLDEARLAAQLRHPNVVATIDLSQDPLFLVMEYVEGPSLHAALRELRKTNTLIPIGVALHIALDVLSGLHAAHELKNPSGGSLGVVHRDVSPHNILLGVDGVTKLTDFGVARAESRIASTHGGRAKGKLAYMSPEQVRALPLDRRSDVFAAGVVLHEILTGEALFRAENEAALVFQVAQGAPTTPAEVNPAVPEGVSAVCSRALATDPAERFPTAADFSDALEEAAKQAGVAVASTKEVARYVSSLALHDEAPPQQGHDASRPSAGSARSSPRAQPSRSSAAELESLIASDTPTLPTNPGPKRALIGVGVGVAVVGLGILVLRSPKEPEAGVAASASSAPAVVMAPVTAPSAATASSVPTPVTSSTPSVPPSASAAASPLPSAPGRLGSGTVPKPVKSVFRPRGL